MGIPLLLLAMALVILLWQDATDKAMRALRERLGQPHDPRGQRIAQAGTWTVIGLILFFLLAPASWYTPAPPPPAPSKKRPWKPCSPNCKKASAH